MLGLRVIGVLLAIGLTPLQAGVTYQLRIDGPKGAVVYAVWSQGSAYRAEARISDALSEFRRQYPIEISTDEGRARRYLRPKDKTWFEESPQTARGSIAIGQNPHVREPSVTLIEESSNDVFAGRPARRFVLKASCVVESEIDTEKIRLHQSLTALLVVTNIGCAHKATEPFERLTLGIPDIDDEVRRKLSSIEGVIVRETISQTDRYDGGPPRTFLTSTEVTDPRCVDLDPALFAVPRDYRHQEPVRGSPGS
jgi:hypothetical protein